jgi:hypothetical protein
MNTTSEVLRFTITSRKVSGDTVYQATANIGTGWGPTEIRHANGSANYPNRRALIKAINRRAASLNRSPEIVCGNKTSVSVVATATTVTTKGKTKTAKANAAKTCSIAAPPR